MNIKCLMCLVLFHFFIQNSSFEQLNAKNQFIHSDNLIDWSDYNFIDYENSRTGIGEQAEAVDTKEFGLADFQNGELFNQNGFNAELSDLISLNRSVYDFRHEKCLHKKYSKILPKVSVIIPFYNEHWSTLLRTVYSIINRTPMQLLVEIILIDDCSTKGNKLIFLKRVGIIGNDNDVVEPNSIRFWKFKKI